MGEHKKLYAGCTLVYKCLVCSDTFTWGPWAELDDPTAPLAFHTCCREIDMNNIWPIQYDRNMKGVGKFIGIIWPEEGVPNETG